jgi:hypothetical protein
VFLIDLIIQELGIRRVNTHSRVKFCSQTA